ncbi:hypothetical protein [Yersinia canariae]|uniref:hypothetical protein n=1 Tax=Yersinia canariae TaxID=2607663 RepID=UPI0015F2BE6A|nr:hypothetical protein [Yersinia canariae]
MPVNLNTIPGPSIRPSPPKPLRWLIVLLGFITVGILLMRFLGKMLGNTEFWWFAIGIPVVFWLVLMGFRLVIYLIQQIQANAWDRRREQVILQEVRRGRRALQILAAECSTAHDSDVQFTGIADALLRNDNKIIPQTAWNGESSVRHSRLRVTEGLSPEAHLSAVFSALLENLTDPLSRLPPDNVVAILLESSSSVPRDRVQVLWQLAWQESGICQPTTLLSGHGLSVIDHWLDRRIKDNALLLVIAAQIAPEQPEMTGEAVVGLLLANRLTQKVLTPLALLHRPESTPPQQETLQAGVLQAADWVPLPPDAIQHLWLAGLPAISEGYRSAISVQGRAPLTRITPGPDVHDFNEFLGCPGCVAPWLAITAAAQAISHSPASHMILSGEQGSDTVWSTVVSPNASRKENET